MEELTQAVTYYAIYEWDGKIFQSLALTTNSNGENWDSIHGEGGPFKNLHYQDLDRNGTLEILFSWYVPVWSFYPEFLPWREQTDFFRWDGIHFTYFRSEYSPPVYRFQAAEDGDQYLLEGDYDRALTFYRQAIFDDKLEWWSPERRVNEQERWTLEWTSGTPEPTPTLPALDSAEYPNLAAYARYRILLIYTLNGWTGEAQAMLAVLQSKFPSGEPGGLYTQLAQIFWEAYLPQKSMTNGCTAANAFAAEHGMELWEYIGYTKETRDDRFGLQGRVYTAEDACPFPR